MHLITAIISFITGSLFGVVWMCLLQCHRLNQPEEETGKEDFQL